MNFNLLKGHFNSSECGDLNPRPLCDRACAAAKRLNFTDRGHRFKMKTATKKQQPHKRSLFLVGELLKGLEKLSTIEVCE